MGLKSVCAAPLGLPQIFIKQRPLFKKATVGEFAESRDAEVLSYFHTTEFYVFLMQSCLAVKHI